MPLARGTAHLTPALSPRKRGRRGSSLLVLALALLALAACGRKGPPMPPGPPDQVTYPRMYPAY